MTSNQEAEISLTSECQNIDEYSKSCINFFSSIINKNDLNSEEITIIVKIISSSLELGYVQDSISDKIIDVLSSSTLIVSHAFQNNYLKIFSSLESIFNPRKSFYAHNSKNKNPSYPWTIVVDNFVQSSGLESILNCLENKKNEETAYYHFIYFVLILKNISSRIENARYQTILKRAINSLKDFLMMTKKYNNFIQLYLKYLELSFPILINPDDFSDFISILNHACQEPKLRNFSCKQILILLQTPAKSLLITQNYCDFILSLDYTEENIKTLYPLYILFAQNNLFNLSNLEMLNNQNKNVILDCIAEYLDPKLLSLFVQKVDLNNSNISIFLQFANHSDEEPLVKSTIQKVLSFGDNENNQNDVYNKFLLLFPTNKILPTIYEEASLLLPTSKTSLCHDLIEKIRAKILENGNYFISHFRNTKSVNQLQQLIDTVSKENQNQSIFDEYDKCQIFEILINDITNNKFGPEGICLVLSFFQSFSSYILTKLDKLIPNLLKIFSYKDGNDKLFLATISLLNELYDLSPDESLVILESNIKELSRAIQNIPESSFDNFKDFVTNLDDKLFFALFTFSKSTELGFCVIYRELENEINKQSNIVDYVKKCLIILSQIDDFDPFEKLFNHFKSKLNQKMVDQNKFVIDDLLKITQNNHSEKILALIFDNFEFFSSLSDFAKKSIDDFLTSLSSTKLNEYNISPLELEQSQSGEKILLSDRSDVDSVLQVLYHSFPFNFLAVTSTETSRYANSISRIQLLFQEMTLSERKFIFTQNLVNYFVKIPKEPADFFTKITKICPETWITAFQFKLETEHSEFINICCLTVPIFGFQTLNEAILDSFKKTKVKFATIPPVLTIQMTQNTNGIEIPIHFDIDQFITGHSNTDYNLTAAVVLDPATNEFNALVKTRENWTLYTNKDSILLSKVDGILKSSHLVFYTKHDSCVYKIINDNLTALFVEHPFNLDGYINSASRKNISTKNECFRMQYSILNESTIKFMIDRSEPITLLCYLIHVICHSTKIEFVENATDKLIKILSGDEIINYIESDFDFFNDSLSNSPYSNQLIKLIYHSISNCSSETLVIHFILNVLKELKNIVYNELNPLSQIILNYVSLSERNIEIARQNNWHQRLIQVVFSVFNFNRKYEYLRNLDLSPLFKTLSILITREFLPDDAYSLLNISEQVLISEKHDHPYLEFLFKLNSFNIFQTQLDANKIISYVNSFQTIIGKGEVPEIPSLFDASSIFKEIQSQVESGNETLRLNMLKVYLPKLITYLEDNLESVRISAQNLLYVLCGYPKKSIYDHVIRELLSRLQNASDCSTIFEVCYNLVDKSKLFDEYYLQSALICQPNLRSSKDINQLLLMYCQLFEKQKVSPNLENLVQSFDGNSDNLIDYLQEFDGDSITETFESPKWNKIMENIDLERKYSLVEKVLPSGKKADSFIANSIVNDQSLTLLNSFLDKSIDRFQAAEVVDLFNLLNLAVKKSNDSIEQKDENQFFLDSIVNFSDAVVPSSTVPLPPQIELDFNELAKFFTNFWPGIPSDKLLLILNKIAGKNPDFLKNLNLCFLNQIQNNKIDQNEKEKWPLAIVCSDVSIKNRDALSLSNDDDLASEIKRIHDLACSQHENLPNSDPRSLFSFYIEKLAEDPKAKWIPILADKLYPEATFSSDEEKEFYKLAMAENREQLASEKAEQITKEKEEKLAKEKARLDQIEKEKAEQFAREKEERIAKEKAKAEQIAKEKEEQLAKEKARLDQIEKAKAEQIAKEKEEQLAKEKARLDQIEKEKAEQIAKEKEEQLAKEKAKAEQQNDNNSFSDVIIGSIKDRSIEIIEEEEEENEFNNQSNKNIDNQSKSEKLKNQSLGEVSNSTVNDNDNNNNNNSIEDEDGDTHNVSQRSPIRGLSNGSSKLNAEQRHLNSLLFGEEEDQIDQINGIEDFSLDEFSNELEELEMPSETATATATVVGTAAITTVSYLLYKYLRKSK